MHTMSITSIHSIVYMYVSKPYVQRIDIIILYCYVL